VKEGGYLEQTQNVREGKMIVDCSIGIVRDGHKVQNARGVTPVEGEKCSGVWPEHNQSTLQFFLKEKYDE
jgi:hypothetical protein